MFAVEAGDIELLEHMRQVGLEVAQRKEHQRSGNEKYQVGFVRPPLNSIHHIHMHVMSLPLRDDIWWMHRLVFSSKDFLFVTFDWILSVLRDKVGQRSKL